MTWYLHYDSEGKPAGFFDSDPDIPFIEINETEKAAIEQDADSFMVKNGALITVPRSVYDPAKELQKTIERLPLVAGFRICTDQASILLALTGFASGKDFAVNTLTEYGRKQVNVNQSQGKVIIAALHEWLANNNLMET